MNVPPLVPPSRKRIHQANLAAAAPAHNSTLPCKRFKSSAPPQPPALVVVPANHAFNDVVIGQVADRQFFLSNAGGGQR